MREITTPLTQKQPKPSSQVRRYNVVIEPEANPNPKKLPKQPDIPKTNRQIAA